MMLNDDRYPVRTQDVAFRTYGSDAVLISPQEGVVRLLNVTATRIWHFADGTRSVNEIAQMLTEEFDVDFHQAQQAVVHLLDQLAEKQLIKWLA
ncbi:MAG: PqqD family protein [Anaerolineae bacterium]